MLTNCTVQVAPLKDLWGINNTKYITELLDGSQHHIMTKNMEILISIHQARRACKISPLYGSNIERPKW